MNTKSTGRSNASKTGRSKSTTGKSPVKSKASTSKGPAKSKTSASKGPVKSKDGAKDAPTTRTGRPAKLTGKALKAKSKFVDYKDKQKKGDPLPSFNEDAVRLNKYLSNAGICSRREADVLISTGVVSVNGEIITELGYKVAPTDVIRYDGATIRSEVKRYVLLNKPKGFSTIGDADKQTSNVMDLVRMATKAKIQPIGRMDKSTTGLLLFTNDSDMLRKFSLPQQRSPKVYQVSLDKNLKYEDLERIQNGIHIDDHKIHVDEIDYVENQPKSEIGLKMKTANVKVVRNIFEHLGYNVLKVDRVMFAGLTKKNLPRGNWRFLTDQEVINLKNI